MSTNLPSELLNLIFEFLSDTPAALKACSLVSRTWHAAAATFLFSSLSLLCSIDQPNPDLTHSKLKRQLGLAYGVLPVYRKRFLMHKTNTHCICNRYKDRTAQAFYYSGASSAHITCNVAELTLKFCTSNGSSEAVYHGPHSLQLYPDANISSLLRLVDELSFPHLRFLTYRLCASGALLFRILGAFQWDSLLRW
ncbi:hypothetical protein BT96DRAFT_633165 [Gymnopus androsaceus JB14]|uniref:F-box domain-containing protein n=1 Tax=Gymnopus androsaceus JB14 TaxID=1447944 RepID=A0A6A4GGV9_9AGAR|nr:hypothetical protein BT96DRAFT_633165 [Gymnopus androsaceus JB14]